MVAKCCASLIALLVLGGLVNCSKTVRELLDGLNRTPEKTSDEPLRHHLTPFKSINCGLAKYLINTHAVVTNVDVDRFCKPIRTPLFDSIDIILEDNEHFRNIINKYGDKFRSSSTNMLIACLEADKTWNSISKLNSKAQPPSSDFTYYHNLNYTCIEMNNHEKVELIWTYYDCSSGNSYICENTKDFSRSIMERTVPLKLNLLRHRVTRSVTKRRVSPKVTAKPGVLHIDITIVLSEEERSTSSMNRRVSSKTTAKPHKVSHITSISTKRRGPSKVTAKPRTLINTLFTKKTVSLKVTPKDNTQSPVVTPEVTSKPRGVSSTRSSIRWHLPHNVTLKSRTRTSTIPIFLFTNPEPKRTLDVSTSITRRKMYPMATLKPYTPPDIFILSRERTAFPMATLKPDTVTSPSTLSTIIGETRKVSSRPPAVHSVLTLSLGKSIPSSVTVRPSTAPGVLNLTLKRKESSKVTQKSYTSPATSKLFVTKSATTKATLRPHTLSSLSTIKPPAVASESMVPPSTSSITTLTFIIAPPVVLGV